MSGITSERVRAGHETEPTHVAAVLPSLLPSALPTHRRGRRGHRPFISICNKSRKSLEKSNAGRGAETLGEAEGGNNPPSGLADRHHAHELSTHQH